MISFETHCLFSWKQNGFLSSLPYLAMWIFSIMISWVADWMISSQRFNHTQTRKIINSIGQYGPAVCLIAASYTGCDRVLTVALLTIGVGLNGGIYSGFKINHLDITPRFAGILMSLTNCTANLAGLLAPITAGILVEGKVRTNIFWVNLDINSFSRVYISPQWQLGRKYSLSLLASTSSVPHFTMSSVVVNVNRGTIQLMIRYLIQFLSRQSTKRHSRTNNWHKGKPSRMEDQTRKRQDSEIVILFVINFLIVSILTLV